MNFNLYERTAFLTVAGSWSYGTATDASDVDVRGFAIPPRAYRSGFLHSFEQADSPSQMECFRNQVLVHFSGAVQARLAAGEKIDGAVYDLRKFVKLAVEANPNILDVLFAPRDAYIIVTPFGRQLINDRLLFLSRKVVHTFRGYGVAQIKKIDRHHRWLRDPPTAPPTRADFDLPERTVMTRDQLGAVLAEVRARIDSWEVDFADTPGPTKIHVQEQLERTLEDWRLSAESEKFFAAGKLLGFDTNFLQVMDNERRYRRAMEEWQHYEHWKKTRNPARAVLEAQYGYDTKHGAQLVRLLQACRDILVTGDYPVRRPNRDELLAIRGGSWSYDRLMGWARDQDAELLELAKTSPLPHSPDRKKIEAVLCDIIDAADAEEQKA